MESGFTISGLLFEMAALTTDLDLELMPEKELEDYCFFFSRAAETEQTGKPVLLR